MKKSIKWTILIILIIIVIIFIFNKELSEGFEHKINNKQCNSKGCPVTKSQNDVYKLHVDHKSTRDYNHVLTHSTKIGDFFFNSKGPANIFIIRHGEKIKSKNALDCNGILRSSYIPTLISDLNKKGFGIYSIITTNNYLSMHQEQTVLFASWLLSIPLFIYGEQTDTSTAITNVFTNSAFNGKTVLFCWEHNCIQTLLKDIITIGAKLKGLKNYTFKNPKGTSELPYWDSDNYKSIYHFDENLNFDISEENFTSCYKEENDKIKYGKEQNCIDN